MGDPPSARVRGNWVCLGLKLGLNWVCFGFGGGFWHKKWLCFGFELGLFGFVFLHNRHLRPKKRINWVCFA